MIRCFDDPMIPHIEGSVDAVRDKEIVDLELQVRDLESVDKKIAKVEKMIKAGDEKLASCFGESLLFKDHLESFQSANLSPVS